MPPVSRGGTRSITWLYAFVNDLSHDLRDVVVRLSRQLRRQGGRHDLPIGALSALGALSRHGSMTVGEMARHEQVSQPLVTRTTRRLEERGFIERTEDPDDGRVTRITITPEGAALVARRRAAASSWLGRRIERLSAKDQRTLRDAIAVLERLVDLPAEDPEEEST
jgi:DNA-binding MarR family transcriptional regulator